MNKRCLLFSILFLYVQYGTSQSMVPPVFINEIHYWTDSPGNTDAFVEIAGPKDTNLSGWSLFFYNLDGIVDYEFPLSGIIDDEDGLGGALAFFTPDGISTMALVRKDGSVAQFLGVGGSTNAIEGPANGMSSENIGVLEGPGDDPQLSLQQQSFLFPSHLNFQGPNPESPGDLNDGFPAIYSFENAPIIDYLDVYCTSDNTTEIEIEITNELASVIPGATYTISIGDEISIEDIVPVDTIGPNEYFLVVNIGSTDESQHRMSLDYDLGDESQSTLTLVALPPCGSEIDVDSDGIYNENDNCWYTANPEQLDLNNDGIGDACETEAGEGTGQIGIGTNDPRTKLEVTDGDVFIENVYRGIILRSTGGKCFRVKPDENGNLISTEISCPE